MGVLAGLYRMKGSFLLLCLVSFFPGAQSGDQMPSIVTSYVQVKEDTPINEFAFQIETQDPDVPPDPLKYYLSGPKANLFKVDENTGRVTIRNKLDREDDDKGVFTIEISISDGKYRVSKEIQIIISDANDNKPIFQDAPYNENVKENTPLDTVLFQVSATDADSGLAAVIKYHIDDASPTNGLQHFSINENTGQVKLIKNLNFNGLSTFYRLRINATDGGGPSYYNVTEFLSSTAFAFITVVDVPDLDPSFLNTPYTASVNEHSKVGLPVFKVSAIDKDTGINDVITYSIEATNPPDLFEISASDGIISVKSDIDREALLDIDAEVILTVKATEENPSILGFRANSSTQVKITINDINDNKPKFYNCDMEPCEETSIFTANIFEHSSKNLPVDGLKIKAKDMDARENGKFELHLEGPDKNAFTVLPSVAYSESEIQILVKNPDDVDYEKSTSMVVQIVAKDPNKETNCCSTATVTIQIKDINDWSPKFPEATYHLEINEHSANGTTVATIIAFDPDTMDVGKIRYRLLPDNILKYFDVDPTTGRVFVANSKLIDREVMDLHSPTLQARDMANNTGTTVLMIKLKDINDHKPKFNKDYVEYIEENSSLRIHVQATDQDEPPNSDIVYGIEKSHYSDNFTIDPTSGWLQNKGPIDRESMRTEDHGKINLTVKATDGGEIPESDSVSVIINVDDINDNGPKFRKDSYKFSVEEGKKAEFVGSVRAVDSDQTNNYNRISFRISSGSFGQFIIQTFIDQPEGYIGNITVDPDIELDYESTTKTFHLTVEAMDLGTGVDSVRVEVNVLDVNDERPKFIQKGPFFVDENSNIVDVGSFDAQDLDTNHSLIYELVSSKCRCNESLGLQPCEEDWFTLEPNGKILLNREFVVDYEKCVEVVLEAQVVDVLTQKGENNSETTGTVVIYINDVNDNPPVFEKTDNFYVVVSETASVGSEIASVSATDRDSGRNRHMTFSIAAVNFVDDVTNITSNKELVFKVVSTQEDDKFVGKIQNNEALNIDVKGKYLVTVVARNTEMPNLFSETKLEILTVDKSLKVELLFSKPEAQVKAEASLITMLLTSATQSKVEVVKIRSKSGSSETRASTEAIMEVYFVYANGTALNSDSAEIILSNSKERFRLQTEYGLKDIGGTEVVEKQVDPVLFVLLGLVAGLIIVLAVMSTTLVCTRRSYRTKLKAAKAMNSAAMMGTGVDQKNGPVVPGTNKYTMDGANPVLNLNMDTATDLGFDEEGSNTDRLSLNSLDYNIDMVMSDKDNMPMMRIQEEDEVEYEDKPYVEPLSEALAQRGKKRDTNSPKLTFNNPAFSSTTDL
ncbi:cadherin-related family member 2 isoform X1 [Esox lucius]|uniref:Cadherin domain-containing protein n=2 Tax=Esox lucius TaxID=8010 RepID=A0AAY5KS69_ESOLU|nr:cadherin-related family member 2 isoform X1 [Esox lucius]